MGPQFFQTMMGKTFFEGTVPRIAKSLAKIATELKRQNDLKEIELGLTSDTDVKDIAGEFITGGDEG
jgi:hypothetical protein